MTRENPIPVSPTLVSASPVESHCCKNSKPISPSFNCPTVPAALIRRTKAALDIIPTSSFGSGFHNFVMWFRETKSLTLQGSALCNKKI